MHSTATLFIEALFSGAAAVKMTGLDVLVELRYPVLAMIADVLC